jgi:hypothetical protein
MELQRRTGFLVVTTVALVAGCTGKKLDVGGNAGGAGPATTGGGPVSTGGGSPGTGGSTSGGQPGRGWPSEDECAGGAQLPIVGTWQGYVENFEFFSGSDAVDLVISHANASNVCGKLTFGMGTPPPPPTDPDVGYPPGEFDGGAPFPPSREVRGFEGVPMTLLEGHVSDPRLQFKTTTSELWRAWCELQTPYRQEAPGEESYMCVPFAHQYRYSPDTGCIIDSPSGGVPVDCGKLVLCSHGICFCTASGCTADPTGEITFDLRVSGNQMTGSVSLSGAPHNLYLTRVP